MFRAGYMAICATMLLVGAGNAQAPEKQECTEPCLTFPAAPSPQQNLGSWPKRVRPDSRSELNSLPNAPSYQHLTQQQKFDLFSEYARSPLTFVAAGFSSGYDTATDNGYGPGAANFGKTYAAAVARQETSAFLGKFLFPTLLQQDPRYHESRRQGLFARSFYAASRVLIGRSDSGAEVVNTSYLMGALASSALSNYYRPKWQRGPGSTFSDFGATIGSDAGMNIFREFWPQVRERLSNYTPGFMKKVSEKITRDPATGDALESANESAGTP